MEVILASQSPRRKELMGVFHIPFTVRVSQADESMDPSLSPAEAVAAVSRRKAEAVEREADDLVIAADTIVVVDREILGKPRDEADASRMLHLLSGRDHQVMPGMTLLRGEKCLVCTEITNIHFRELTDREIDAYIATKEPMDKAGSYGIQGGAALFAERLVGDYYNVMGLPVCSLWKALKECAPQIMEDIQ